LKNVITIAAGTLALSVASRATHAAPPEYNRGYNDCLAGRYVEGEGQYNHSYGQTRRARGTGGDERPHQWRFAVGIPNVTEWSPGADRTRPAWRRTARLRQDQSNVSVLFRSVEYSIHVSDGDF
jgi:hypothetical protein